MKLPWTRRRYRKEQGASLAELMVSMSIMSIAAAGVLSLAVMGGKSSMKIFNKLDSTNAARNVIDRIGKDIRTARNIGDIYLEDPGDDENDDDDDTDDDSDDVDEDQPTEGSTSFPSVNNPLYGAGQSPTGGWPATPWPNPPYNLSNTCLVVQMPIFDANGFPTAIAIGEGNPPAVTILDNVDTYVYQILPDTANSGEYMMQVAMFPGDQTKVAAAQRRPILNPPRTILKGIIGPKDTNGNLKCFQFVSAVDPTPLDTVTATQVPNMTGVVVNLELKRKQAGNSTASTIGIKSEVFLRNNTLSTTAGQL